MTAYRLPKICALTAAIAGGIAPGSRLLATTYTWVGPYTGASTSNPFSNASSWSGNQIPTSSTTTQLVFTNFDANAYTAVNNLSSPSFALNNLSIENWSQGGTVALTSLNASGGTCQLQMAGASPSISLSGPSGDTIGTLTSGSGFGLFLNPTGGTTTISDTGNAAASIGSTNAGINGSGGLVINDTGLATIVISSPSVNSTYANDFTGGVSLAAGSLEIASPLSLGSNTLTINGGNLRSTSATFSNPIVANSDLVIFSGTPTIQGVISGNGGLHLYNGAAYTNAIVTLSNTETYRGATIIDAGPLRTNSTNLGALNISSGASILGTSAINVGQSGTLMITAGSTNSSLPSGAPITLSGAVFNVSGTNVTTAESFGNLSNTGLTTLTYSSTIGSTTNTLNFGAYSATDHGTLFLRGNWLGAGGYTTFGVANFSSGISTVSDPNAPTGYLPVVPFAVGGSTSSSSNAFNAFVTRSSSGLSLLPVGGSGVSQFTALSNGFASLPANDVYLNVNQSCTMSGDVQVYALAAGTSSISSLTIGGSGSLNVASGAMIVTSPITLAGPTISFGSNTGYIHAGYPGTSLVIDDTASSITGSNGVVISAPAETAVPPEVQFSDLNGNTDSSNPFTGGLTLNGGVDIAYTNDLQLGAAGQSITLNGGELLYDGNGNATLSRPIRLGASGGGINCNTYSTINVSSLISGPGAFYMSTGFASAGTTVLSNSSNSYSGGTYLYVGTLNISADGDLGAQSAPLVLAGGTLQFGASTTLNRPMSIWAASTIDTNGYSSTIAGSFSSVAVTGGFTVIGGGTLNLTGSNPLLSGGLTVSNATLAISGNGALPQVPNVTVGTVGTFQFNNSGTNLSTRFSPLGRITLAGGTLDLLGNSATATAQTIGGINLAPTVNVSNSTISVEPASAVLTVANDLTGGSSYALVTAPQTATSFTATSVTAAPQSLTKTGSGTLTLSGTNSFAGGLLVSGGTVKTTNTGSLGFGAVVAPTLGNEATIGSTAVPTGGSLDLSGMAITEPVTLNGGSLINSSATPATLTSGVKGVSFNATATSVNYAAAVGQTVGSSGAGYLPGDSISYTGGSGASASLVLGLTSASFNVSYGGNYTQAYSGPNISITSSNGVGSGATAIPITDSNNDITGIDVTNPGYGYTAAPIITITALGQNITPAVVTGNTTGFGVVGIQQTTAGSGYSSASMPSINSATGSGLELNAPVVGSLTLQSNSSVGGTGNITISPTITGSGGLTKIGPDTVVLCSTNLYNGATVVDSGLLVASEGLSSLGTSTTITINGGNLILKNTSAATVFAMLQSGYDQGTWNGSTGVNSAAAASAPSQLYAVGMLQPAANTTFEGQLLTAGDVAVKYTYYGDADLNGEVDGSDYARIDNGYMNGLTGWSNGDFNYDNVVDGSDYTLMDNAFNSQGASLAAVIASPAAIPTAQIAGAASSVPEPAALCLVGIASLGMLGRRTRTGTGRARQMSAR